MCHDRFITSMTNSVTGGREAKPIRVLITIHIFVLYVFYLLSILQFRGFCSVFTAKLIQTSSFRICVSRTSIVGGFAPFRLSKHLLMIGVLLRCSLLMREMQPSSLLDRNYAYRLQVETQIAVGGSKMFYNDVT